MASSPQNQPPAPTLLIVDGHAYAYRAFFAIRSLSSPTGAPTNAVFGFIKAIAKLRAQARPTHVAVVWDGGLSAERMELLPAYKAQRPPMPAGLETQLDQIMAWLRAMGIASHFQEGVEADDWIATLARTALAAGACVLIASSDKDFMQLVSPRVGLINPNDKTEKVWGADEVRARTGVEPRQIVDWLSLVGDSVDNIPGVPGIGPKTAAALLGQFESCDLLLQRLGEVDSERLRTALEAAGETIRRNRRMIRLKDDLPGDASLVQLAPQAPDNPRLRELYSRWGFRSLLKELPAEAPAQRELF
jgi:DNA polymerase-1